MKSAKVGMRSIVFRLCDQGILRGAQLNNKRQNQIHRMKLNPANITLGVALAIGLCLAVPLSSHATTITKTNNTDNLNLGSSWVGGTAPGSGDVALWNSMVTGANTVGLGAALAFQGITIANPGGLVTISDATYGLTINSSGIDMSSASADLTISPKTFTAGASQTWNIGAGRTLTITPTFSVQGNRTLTLSGSGIFTSTGWMQVGSAGTTGAVNQISGTWSPSPSGTVLFLGHSVTAGSPGVGVYNLYGGTIALTGSQELRLGNQTASGDGTLNVTNGAITSSTSTTLLRVGYYDGSKGTYIQSGGTVTIGQMDIASLNAVGAGCTGVATNSGGILNVTTLQVGAKQNGAFTLTDTGWLNLSGTATIGGLAGSSGMLNLNGGTLNMASTSAALTTGASGTVNANGVTITNGSTGLVTLAAPMTLGAGGIACVSLGPITGHNISFTGNLSGTGGVMVGGTGGVNNVYLSGSNSFSGPVSITNGYLHNNGPNAIPVGIALTNNAAWAMDYSVTLGSFAGSGNIFRAPNMDAGTLTVGYNDANGSYSGPIAEGAGSPPSLLSLTKIGNGTLILSGNSTYTGNTTVNGGVLQIGNGGTAGSVVGNITNNSQLIFNRSNSLTSSNAVSGTGSVTKSGAGTLTLSTNNTYTGNTTVNNGILKLSATGSISNSAVINVASGAVFDVSAWTSGYTATNNQILAGNGLVTGSVVVASSAGVSGGMTNDVGILTFTNNLTLNNGAVVYWNYDATTSDVIHVTGTLTLPTVATVVVSQVAGKMPSSGALFSFGSVSPVSPNLQGWVITGATPTTRARVVGNQVKLITPTGWLMYVE